MQQPTATDRRPRVAKLELRAVRPPAARTPPQESRTRTPPRTTTTDALALAELREFLANGWRAEATHGSALARGLLDMVEKAAARDPADEEGVRTGLAAFMRWDHAVQSLFHSLEAWERDRPSPGPRRPSAEDMLRALANACYRPWSRR